MWILPYLPPVFALRDFYLMSDQVEESRARAYLEAKVRDGRLVSLGKDRYGKVGYHVCGVTFRADQSITWGSQAHKVPRDMREARKMRSAREAG